MSVRGTYDPALRRMPLAPFVSNTKTALGRLLDCHASKAHQDFLRRLALMRIMPLCIKRQLSCCVVFEASASSIPQDRGGDALFHSSAYDQKHKNLSAS